MSEKRKWFDPQMKVMTRIDPVLVASNVTKEHIVTQLPGVLGQKGVCDASKKLFCSLAKMRPADRLKRNLVVLLGIMANGDDGLFSESENNALVEFELSGVSRDVQELLQGLLNIYERYQSKQSLGTLFTHWRGRETWRAEADKKP